MIKCILLNAHCTLIAEVVEVDAELGNPNCKLIKPYVLTALMIWCLGKQILQIKQNL